MSQGIIYSAVGRPHLEAALTSALVARRFTCDPIHLRSDSHRDH